VGLEALPLYDAIARMKVQAHWQTDVLAALRSELRLGISNINGTARWCLA